MYDSHCRPSNTRTGTKTAHLLPLCSTVAAVGKPPWLFSVAKSFTSLGSGDDNNYFAMGHGSIANEACNNHQSPVINCSDLSLFGLLEWTHPHTMLRAPTRWMPKHCKSTSNAFVCGTIFPGLSIYLGHTVFDLPPHTLLHDG